jgi:DNA topoisomerase-1
MVTDRRPPLPATARRDATASGLRYVSLYTPGYQRRRAGRGFTYHHPDGRRVTSPSELARIRALAIPPAWTDVWICPREDGHIQAVGRDARNRRQYRYHAGFRARRDRGKFARLIRFGEGLPRIRRRVRSDLRRQGLPKEKVLATVVSLLEATRLRVGSPEYARLNRSFGLSTLHDRHARVTTTTLHLRFRGKGGRIEERRLVDRRLATVVRRCQELPGQELFQYLDEAGEPRAISSEDVNGYLREAAGTDEISAKDFRTWAGTVLAFRLLREGIADDQVADAVKDAVREGPARAARKRRANPIVEALRRTAEELGDTLAVTRSSYVHPGVIAAFEPGAPAAAELAAAPRRRAPGPDRREELELLRLLKRSSGSGARRPPSAARRSQVGKARLADRSSRPAA